MENIVEFISRQNPLILTLFATSVVCVAVVLDRIFFWLSSAMRYRPIPLAIYCRANSRNTILIRELSAKKHRHYMQEIVLAALEHPDFEDHLAQTVSEQVAIMSARLGMLDLIAKIAPLVGILGTVIGMAVSFGGISAIVTASPAAISNGISIALKTTAYGLIISIVASVASASFRKFTNNATIKIGRIICEIQNNTQDDI